MKAVALLLGVLLVSDALACYSPPPEQHVSPKELIKRTRNIVLAQVTKAELAGNEVLYTFKRLEVLSGTAAETFQFRSPAGALDGDTSNFSHHFDPAFWQNNAGRTPNFTDCLIHPGFSVGGTYLLFLDKPYHVKSFELVIRLHGDSSTKDKWLQYVQANVTRSGRRVP